MCFSKAPDNESGAYLSPIEQGIQSKRNDDRARNAIDPCHVGLGQAVSQDAYAKAEGQPPGCRACEDSRYHYERRACSFAEHRPGEDGSERKDGHWVGDG